MNLRIVFGRGGRWLIPALGSLLFASAALAQGGPYKSVSYKTGELEFKLDGVAYSAKLGQVGTNLDFFKVFGKDEQAVGASFTSPAGAENRAVARFHIQNVHGPGTYQKADIQNFVLSWGPVNVWNYNWRRDACVFTFSRLDEGGMEGNAACSGGEAPAFKDLKFRSSR